MERRVVITGVGVVSPIGNNICDFKTNLFAGKNGIDTIKAFDTVGYKASLAGEVKDFDPLQYMEKSEARKYDSYTQFALAAAAQAVQDSKITESLDNNMLQNKRFGVYVGSGIGGMQTFVEECTKLVQSGPRRISPFFVPMMIANMASGLIAIKHKAQGPCLPIVTACATGTHSIGEAFNAIRNNQADAIIAGGSEAAITELSVAGFGNAMALSPNPDPATACRPFDKDRDGFVMGEGSGILILEEYEHAKARKANIYCEIVGYSNTCDAYHVTAPDPHATMATETISQAFKQAGIINDDGDVTADIDRVYINAHGTSTNLNDKCETMAIKKVLGSEAYNVHISSTKSMTGHMLGAAGAVEAIVCALAIQNKTVPPTINYHTVDPECDLNYTPNISIEKDLTYAASTSLGFGGHNACIVFRKMEE
ncbi:MAG: beta-ketoacyl-ACP synthase II [Clostridia bacterium]|nr:beta-ketoacyl-ACP synthase II [Clostridia bacterium]